MKIPKQRLKATCPSLLELACHLPTPSWPYPEHLSSISCSLVSPSPQSLIAILHSSHTLPFFRRSWFFLITFLSSLALVILNENSELISFSSNHDPKAELWPRSSLGLELPECGHKEKKLSSKRSLIPWDRE